MEWHKVSEDNLPKHTGLFDGTTDDVLLYFGNSYYQPVFLVGCGEFTEDGFKWHTHGRLYHETDQPTHWAYLERPE